MDASTSAWAWSEKHRLYYNIHAQTWAAPQPDGSWTYSTSTVAAPAQDAAAQEAEEREEGEDVDGVAIPPEQVWPGDESDEDVFARTPLLRLVVSTSAILKPATVALVDPADGVSLGRDKTFEKRIRLPELLVSKSHAQVFWMQPRADDGAMRGGGWAVADQGSTHGTFVRSLGGPETRLSAPKVASSPRELSHLE